MVHKENHLELAPRWKTVYDDGAAITSGIVASCGKRAALEESSRAVYSSVSVLEAQ